MNNAEYFDPHYPCNEKLKRLNADWADRYYNSSRVKSVVMEEVDIVEGKTVKVLQVIDVVNEDDGLTIIVR